MLVGAGTPRQTAEPELLNSLHIKLATRRFDIDSCGSVHLRHLTHLGEQGRTVVSNIAKLYDNNNKNNNNKLSTTKIQYDT